MIKLKPKDKNALLKAALGEIPCDLAVKNVKVVNVFTGFIDPAVVYIHEGFIAHVEYDHPETVDAPAKEVIDGKGQFMTPGFIDAHMHIESSMLTPRNFAKVVIPHGTTTIITDPHEIGNVLGVEGVKYMHNTANDLPMRQLIDVPSCVPALPGKEFTGADFQAPEIAELAKLERVVGLAEVMDFLAVIHGEDRMNKILEVAEENGLYLQGHSPMVSGRMLSAYLCGGPNTDHESHMASEAYEKYRAGMHIDMRESSMTKNVTALWKGLRNVRYLDTLCLCTDDRESEDLLKIGHINDVVRHAVREGMNPVDAVKCCTINTAREIRMEHLGAIAPGYVADFNLFPDLWDFNPSMVFYGGQKVAENGKLIVEIPDETDPIEDINTMNLPDLTVDDFTIKCPIENGKVKVNVIQFENHFVGYTKQVQTEVEVKDGKIVLPHEDMKFVAVVNRFGKHHIALALVERVGLLKGALASTVSHDSHNLTIVYDKPENALIAAEQLKDCGGGMCTVDGDGTVLGVLPLPIAGLLSKEDAEHTAVLADKLKQADRKVGLTEIPNPLLRIVVLALPVAPDIKMSDMGMIDVATKNYVPVFVEE